MKRREFYNYKNGVFDFMRDPMRKVMSAYGEAERFFATIKEKTWANFGLKSLTNYIHALEHLQGDYVDEFKAILAELGLEVEYPAVGELVEEMPDLDKVFEVCVGIVDDVDEALRAFIILIDGQHKEYSALARKMENLQMKNSAQRSFMLEAWNMADNDVSLSSFDNWVARHAPYMKDEEADK